MRINKLKKTIKVSQSSPQKVGSSYILCLTTTDHCMPKYVYHKVDALPKQKVMPFAQQNLASDSFMPDGHPQLWKL